MENPVACYAQNIHKQFGRLPARFTQFRVAQGLTGLCACRLLNIFNSSKCSFAILNCIPNIAIFRFQLYNISHLAQLDILSWYEKNNVWYTDIDKIIRICKNLIMLLISNDRSKVI